MSKNHCQWVKGNDKLCNLPSGDKQYCYTHAPLAQIGYTRPPREPLDSVADAQQDRNPTVVSRDQVEALRKQWGVELEQEFQESKKRKGKVIKPSDFPNYFDGIFYNSIEEYVAMHSELEMPGTDQQERYDKHRSPKAGSTAFNDWQKYTPESKKKDYRSAYSFEKKHYILKDSIAHMRYVVYRAEDGLYYAVFMSLWRIDSKLEDLLNELTKVTLPLTAPHVAVVNGVEIGQFHSSKGYATYYGAEDRFTTGGESLSRIKERMRKAADPNWIPPNLRKMAVEATYDPTVWDYIPKHEHERLQKWLDAGCPGWFSKMPKGWKSKNSIYYGTGSSGYYSGGSGQSAGGSGQTVLFGGSLDKQSASYASSVWFPGAVWDGEIAMWIGHRKKKK